MENLKKITEAFEGEDEIVLICSKKLASKLDTELAEMTVQEGQYGVFENKVDSGFNSVCHNGITIHYTSDISKLLYKKNKNLAK